MTILITTEVQAGVYNNPKYSQNPSKNPKISYEMKKTYNKQKLGFLYTRTVPKARKDSLGIKELEI
jgi:hypothetical protein